MFESRGEKEQTKEVCGPAHLWYSSTEVPSFIGG